MINLTLLELNPRSHRVQAELRNPYELHRTLSKAFGDDGTNYVAARCLFRVEISEKQPRVMVQSLCKPQWKMLTVGEDYYTAPLREKELKMRLQIGQQLRFRLCANPTKRLMAGCPGEKKDGKRIELKEEGEQIGWLMRKGASGGFTLLHC